MEADDDDFATAAVVLQHNQCVMDFAMSEDDTEDVDEPQERVFRPRETSKARLFNIQLVEDAMQDPNLTNPESLVARSFL